MNIAMMVRGYIPVPRPHDMIYAPIDLASKIAQSMARRGHKIDFYAPQGSKLPGVTIKSLGIRPLVQKQDDFKNLISDIDKMVHYFPAMWEGYMVNEMFAQAKAGKYDLLHFHHPEIALQQAAANPEVQVVYTLHDPINEWYKEAFEIYRSSNQRFVSISNNQRRAAPDLPYLKTVHNGVDVSDFPFSDTHDDYLLFAGRIVPEKGVREAVQVAKASNHRLLIIGPTYPDKQAYFDQHIKPYLDDQILYLGYVDLDQMPRYFQKAKALLTPVQWEEPFGLTTIEAMASGTPVISYRRGAAPEIIVDGKTGFIVDTTAQMVEAVHKVRNLKRADAREHVRTKFSVENMVDSYELAFRQMLSERKKFSTHFVRVQLHKMPARIRTGAQKRGLKKAMASTRQERVRLNTKSFGATDS